MLAQAGRRFYVLFGAILLSFTLLLMLHTQPDRLPFLSPASHAPRSRLDQTCSEQDPFEVEYGRTNLRLSRAYEGMSLPTVPC